MTPPEPLQHHAHTLTCRHAGEFQIVAGENVPGSLTFGFRPRVKKSLFGNRIGPLISFLRSSSTTMSATDAGLSSDIANTARLRGCELMILSENMARTRWIDVHTAIGRHRAAAGPDADWFSEIWRSKQLEYTWDLDAGWLLHFSE